MARELTRRELIAGGAALMAASATLPAGRARAAAQEGRRTGMKLGMISYNVAKDWDLPTLLSHCKAAGWEGVELRTTHAHGVETTLSAAQRREVRQRIADSGVALWGFGTVCEFHSPEPAVAREHIESCKRWCELARDTGAQGVKVRPNGLPDGVPVEKTLEQIGNALRECGDAAAGQGVEIWVEVHGRETQNPPNMRKILDLCGHPQVGICWNSNRTDVANGSVREAFDLLKPDLRSCHINNLWDKTYPYRELFALLRENGYDRFTLCEVGTPVRAEDGVVFMQCYKGLWEELQRP